MGKTTARKVLIPIGDASEVLDTFYPLFRFEEAGLVPVVAGPRRASIT
jgi:protease I